MSYLTIFQKTYRYKTLLIRKRNERKWKNFWMLQAAQFWPIAMSLEQVVIQNILFAGPMLCIGICRSVGAWICDKVVINPVGFCIGFFGYNFHNASMHIPFFGGHFETSWMISFERVSCCLWEKWQGKWVTCQRRSAHAIIKNRALQAQPSLLSC